MINSTTEDIGEVFYVHDAEFVGTETIRAVRMAKFQLAGDAGPLWMDWCYFDGALLTREANDRIGIQGRASHGFDPNRYLVSAESAERFIRHWIRECPGSP